MEEFRQSYVDIWLVSNFGNIKNKKLNKIIKPYLHNKYLVVGSNSRFQKIRRHKVHRLVCFAFHGEEPDGYCVDHIDGDKQNNHADNLRWCNWNENSGKGNS